MMTDGSWKTISSEIVLSNRWLDIIKNKVITPGGDEGEYFVYSSKPAVYILAFDGEAIYFIQQFRYPIKNYTLEIPAGSIEDGTPLESAKQELLEETNIKGNKWEDLGEFFALPGVSDKKFNLFLATELEVQEDSLKNVESNENIMKRVKYTIPQIKSIIKENQIKDIPTLACLNIFFQKFNI